jgi:hypothetical protein
MTLASSPLAGKRSAGCMRNNWYTSWAHSPTCIAPHMRRRGELRVRFDHIFRRRTGFVALDRLLVRLHAIKPELLMVRGSGSIAVSRKIMSALSRHLKLCWTSAHRVLQVRAAVRSEPDAPVFYRFRRCRARVHDRSVEKE